MATLILTTTLTLTAYAPSCGGLNGSLRNFYADGSSRPLVEHSLRYAACGPRFEFGTVLSIDGMADHGVREIECHDRGSSVRGADVLVLTGRGCVADRALAREIGRRRVTARVLPSASWRARRGV